MRCLALVDGISLLRVQGDDILPSAWFSRDMLLKGLTTRDPTSRWQNRFKHIIYARLPFNLWDRSSLELAGPSLANLQG